jgi:hypothetical protein
MSPNQLACPVLDLLTNNEIHQALLRAVLVRQKVQDPDTLLAENSVESQVMYREVRLPDGSEAMMASVAITKVVPHPAPPAPTTDSQPKVE